MKRWILIIALVAGISGLVLFYEARRESSFLRMSASLAVEVFTRKTTPDAIERFHRDMGRFPTSAEGLAALLRAPVGDDGGRWRGPYLESKALPRDPWNREYRYRYPGVKNPQGYDLWSLGKDGIASEDDIGNWGK